MNVETSTTLHQNAILLSQVKAAFKHTHLKTRIFCRVVLASSVRIFYHVGLDQAPYLTLGHIASGPDLKYETDVSIDVCFDQNEELTQRDDKNFYAYRIEVRRIAEQFYLNHKVSDYTVMSHDYALFHILF